MLRRSSLKALMLVLLQAACPVRARPADGVPLVGYVSWFPASEAAQMAPLSAGLAELGWSLGEGIRIETHFTDGDAQRTRAAIASLLSRGVDVLVVRATNVAHIAKEMAVGVPVVMLVSDPLATGLVQDLARPQGNMTGLSLQGPDLAGKRLEYLRMAIPRLKAVAFLVHRPDPNAKTFVEATRAAADAMGLRLVVHWVDSLNGYQESNFASMARAGCQALSVQPIFTGQQERIVALALHHRIAVISNYPAFARAGALLTLGPDDQAITRRAAYYVHRLLKSAHPGDLPVEQPSRFTMAISRKSARALGIALPEALLLAADQVFD
jgi:putative ABC transport system substrate-binding protein